MTNGLMTSQKTGQPPYFTRREPTGDYDGYWDTVVDPDGVERDLSSDTERLRYLDDRKEEIEFVQSLIGLYVFVSKPRILDIGCGRGWFLDVLENNWSKHGTELEENRHDIPNAEVHPPNLQFHPFKEYDAITCNHVIEHVDTPVEWMREIINLLKPGGHLLLGTPDFASPCAKRFGDNYRLLHDKTHVSLFTNESMHRLLRDVGFIIDQVEYPFPERYATAENFARWNDTSKMSPAWPGNFMTFYCRKPHEEN